MMMMMMGMMKGKGKGKHGKHHAFMTRSHSVIYACRKGQGIRCRLRLELVGSAVAAWQNSGLWRWLGKRWRRAAMVMFHLKHVLAAVHCALLVSARRRGNSWLASSEMLGIIETVQLRKPPPYSMCQIQTLSHQGVCSLVACPELAHRLERVAERVRERETRRDQERKGNNDR